MNNTMSNQGSRVFERHFKLLAFEFEDFVSTTLGVPGVVKPNTARSAAIKLDCASPGRPGGCAWR